MMKYHNRWYTESDSAGFRPSDGEGWGEWRSSNPEKTGGEVSKKIFFSFFLTLGSQVGLKITRGGGGRTSPGSARNFPSYRSYSKNFSHM